VDVGVWRYGNNDGCGGMGVCGDVGGEKVRRGEKRCELGEYGG